MAIILLCFVLAVYGGVFLALILMQRTFMYHPDRGDEKTFLTQSTNFKVQPWRSAAGQLIGWKRENLKPAPHRMLILHGNGGSALTRTYFMDGLGQSAPWDFYCLEYPGYGWREGAPTQGSIMAAANQALAELSKQDSRPLYIAGESLGTGVACLLAAEHPAQVRGLFLATPYTSTADVAVGRFPMFPVRWVMQDRYEAQAALQKYPGPVAILLAGQDYIVPTRFGQALYDGCTSPKKLWIQPSAGHNSLDYNPKAKWWREVSEFLVAAR